MRSKRKSGRLFDLLLHPLVLVLIAALVLVAFVWVSPTPKVRGLEAEEVEFSAIRARALLEGILAESRPHVVGSVENGTVRDRIASHLEISGYQPEVQRQFHCNARFASCATVENIIAVKPGADHRKAILLTAHYDSGWAGPGAGDDGAGLVVVLEIARMVAEYGETLNDIIFLFTDGEEQGLIGADAFVKNHPLFDRVAVVINLEARGVTGPSVMFETGEGNRSIIRVLSKNLTRPVANSLAYEVYKRMPNDTDYSVYKKQGVMGLNFAFTGGVALYHSELDDVEHLDLASLQHQGENAWGMVRALVDRNLGAVTSRENAAYIDVFGRLLWHYPESIATGVNLLLTVLLIVGVSLYFPRQLGISSLAWALIGQAVVITFILAGAWLLHWPLGEWVDTHPIEHPSPWIGRLTILVMCLVAVWFSCRLFAHRITFAASTLVCWLSFAALAFWLGFRLPAASFVALVPLCAFVLGMVLDFLFHPARGKLGFATLFGLITASYIAVYHFIMLDVVLPFTHSHIKAVPLILLVLPMLPAWFGRFEEPLREWMPGWVLAGLVVVMAGLHQLVPGFSEDRPRGMNLVHREVPGEEGALVIVEAAGGSADGGYVERHNFKIQTVPAPWSGPTVWPVDERPTVERFAMEIAGGLLQSTQVRVLDSSPDERGEGWWHRVELRPPAQTEQLGIAFPNPNPVVRATVNGVSAVDVAAESSAEAVPGLLRITHPGTSPILVELGTLSDEPFTMAVTTRTSMPESTASHFARGWPTDARAVHRGMRAEAVSEFEVNPRSRPGE